jgi:hypothetical protein
MHSASRFTKFISIWLIISQPSFPVHADATTSPSPTQRAQQCGAAFEATERPDGPQDHSLISKCIEECRRLKAVANSDPEWVFKDMCSHEADRNNRRPDWARF